MGATMDSTQTSCVCPRQHATLLLDESIPWPAMPSGQFLEWLEDDWDIETAKVPKVKELLMVKQDQGKDLFKWQTQQT